MKRYAALFALLLPIGVLAQEYKEPSAASKAYHEYRLKKSVPPYGLEKVNGLLAAAGDNEGGKAIPAKAYLALSLREKFTYTMIHAESYSQNCDIVLPEEGEEKHIYGYLQGDVFNEAEWSDRQRDFLQGNRDSVMALIKESANRSKRLGRNYKLALFEINAVEMIPFLVEFYQRDRKDHDILTVLLMLMLEGKYQPFMSSSSYAKLYGPNSSYSAYLQYNKANEDLIIQRAMDYYRSKK
ncbi:hypothetical protein MKQ68_03700 [Chitinophaga horti]|uniref:DUF4919 domain-containing protein n=1 Tax=Chitinophaga horti TaxID=2920382 RepID=A0ABY6J3V9_9BACT|nr:hypothetical protein [Chitinophaga horti]UYQ94195.1 hypothetical protein MKQ68_03700 [Chitinophaga horti]